MNKPASNGPTVEQLARIAAILSAGNPSASDPAKVAAEALKLWKACADAVANTDQHDAQAMVAEPQVESPMTREEFGAWIGLKPGLALDVEVTWAKQHGAAKTIGRGKGQARIFRGLYLAAVAKYCPAARKDALGRR